MAQRRDQLSFEYITYDTPDEVGEMGRDLIQKAREALTNSYSPYSQFKVAAAILLANGELVTGTNQENSAYPSGLCAERVAAFAAKSQYPNEDIVAVAITASSQVADAKRPVAPCGACRQVLLEYELNQVKPYRIWLTGEGSQVVELESARSLLPLHFFGEDLKKG